MSIIKSIQLLCVFSLNNDEKITSYSKTGFVILVQRIRRAWLLQLPHHLHLLMTHHLKVKVLSVLTVKRTVHVTGIALTELFLLHVGFMSVSSRERHDDVPRQYNQSSYLGE